MIEWAIPMAALIVSGAAVFIAGLSGLFSKQSADEARMLTASKEYVQQLEKRIDNYEEELRGLRIERRTLQYKVDELTKENVELRIRLLELEKKIPL